MFPRRHLAGLIVNAQIIAPGCGGLNIGSRDLPASCMFQRVTPQLMFADDRPPLKQMFFSPGHGFLGHVFARIGNDRLAGCEMPK